MASYETSIYRQNQTTAEIHLIISEHSRNEKAINILLP